MTQEINSSTAIYFSLSNYETIFNDSSLSNNELRTKRHNCYELLFITNVLTLITWTAHGNLYYS